MPWIASPTHRRLHTLALIGAAALACGWPRCSRAQESDALTAARLIEQAFVDVVENSERSVVAITRVPGRGSVPPGEVLDPFQMGFGGNDASDPTNPEYIPDSFGSGVVIENPDRPDERFVLTTYHVALGSLHPTEEERAADVKIYVTLRLRPDTSQGGSGRSGRTVVDADVVGAKVKQVAGRIEAAHPYVDLAVLKLDLEGAGLQPEDVPPLKRGDADHLQKGRLVLALGNPYAQARDGSASVSMGMISNIARRPEPPVQEDPFSDRDKTLHSFGTLLQVDTRLDLGTSGGALLNLDGELIGITTSLAALQGYEKSVGYAIPLDRGTWRIVRDLLNGWEPDLGYMGIVPRTLARHDLPLDRNGGLLSQSSAVQVLMVSANSPASEAGMMNGDLILKVNAQPVYDAPDLYRNVALLGADAVARVQIWRPTKDMVTTLQVRLGKWPVRDDSTLIATRQRFEPWRGMSVDYPTARRRYLPSDSVAAPYPRAVVITGVVDGSPAAAARLSPGDFIQRVGNRQVETPAEFFEAVAETTGNVDVTLLSGERRTIAVP